MVSRVLKFLIFVCVLCGTGTLVYAQAELPDAQSNRPGDRTRRDDSPSGLREMLAKQRTERDKKDYEEMLDRGDEALRLANQLEASFEEKKAFSQQDRLRLESLERVVIKIRKGLGGDDDGEEREDPGAVSAADEPRPLTMEDAFKYLQSTTVKLVDELKKTTRFSISVIAIQSSNSVLKLVRFLRFKK